jgi:hypothetical protein
MERDGAGVGLGRRIWKSLPWVTVAFLAMTSVELFYEAATYRYTDLGWVGKLCDYTAAATVLGGAAIVTGLTLFLRRPS